MDDRPFDHIIVGAGAAGSVLAGRLSADRTCRVLLVEAGADSPPGGEDPAILDPYPVSLADPRFSWPGLVAEVGADPGDGRPRFSRPYLQGYGVGGGSNILGMVALRGMPHDFAEWEAAGARGWGWRDVLPYFRRLESDLDFAGPEHGNDGPMPVRRVAREDWAPFARAVADALAARGHALVDDSNADFRDGVAPVPMTNLPHRRVSAAMAYLGTEARARANLVIVPDTQVARILFDGDAAIGVETLGPGGPRSFRASSIILSAGGLQSPALLMRSGIGPGGHLNALGIDVRRDLPGIGANLMNHAEVTIATYLRAAAMQPLRERGWGQCWLRYSSGEAGCAPGDMGLFAINKASWHRLGRRIGAIGACIFKSYSLGTVRLRSADVSVLPEVKFNLLDDPRDAARLEAAARLSLLLLADPIVATQRHEVFLPSGRAVKALGRIGPWNALRAGTVAAAFVAGPLRRAALGEVLADPAAIAADPQAVHDLVVERAQPTHHVSGTCRMGDPAAPMTVVDAECRVLGVSGLRVVDASIMPTIVSANTHLTVLMIAEKMAAAIAAAQGRPLEAAA